MSQAKKLLRFKLCDETAQSIESTAAQTHISKSELMRLAIAKSLPIAQSLELSSRKAIGATAYCNAYVDAELYAQLQTLAEASPTAKVGSVARALIEHAVEENNYLPAPIK